MTEHEPRRDAASQPRRSRVVPIALAGVLIVGATACSDDTDRCDTATSSSPSSNPDCGFGDCGYGGVGG